MNKTSIRLGCVSPVSAHSVCPAGYLFQISIMRELIHVQVGQCGNQVGTKFWETVAFEEKNTIVVLLYFLIISFFLKPCTRLKKVKIYDN